MKQGIDTFVTLGEQLAAFGADAASAGAIRRACAANPWFDAEDVVRAVDAIRETMLRRDSLEKWLAHYPLPVAEPRAVEVVMAGNIPLVGFFDLLCVVLSGHRCLVKPSSKDAVLMDYVVGRLEAIDPNIPIARADDLTRPDAVIATGSDNANRYFRARWGDIPALLRGSRHSAAVLDGSETPDRLRALCDDMFAYSGLGCRNVSLLFLPRGYRLRLPFGGRLHAKLQNNYRQRKAMLTLEGRPFDDAGGVLLVESNEFPRALSEVSIVRYDRIEEVDRWLAAHDAELQCVVGRAVAHERRVDFGQAQRPALTDYPDGADVMDFLAHL